jgi:hypothetical protein
MEPKATIRMLSANEIISATLNKPESKYGGTRSTLFGRFYERLVARWLEENEGFKFARHSDGSPHKPRIYWKNINPRRFDFVEEEEIKASVEMALKTLKSHCTPDGVFTKDNQLYLWEAKNWPLYPEAGPAKQVIRYLFNNPWVLANTCVMGGQDREITGFFFSYWNIEPETKANIESRINRLVGRRELRIVLTAPILENWYRSSTVGIESWLSKNETTSLAFSTNSSVDVDQYLDRLVVPETALSSHFAISFALKFFYSACEINAT